MSDEMGLVAVAWRYRGPKGGWITVEEKPTGWSSEPLYDAAAIERLRDALRPFAAEADRWIEMGDTRPISSDTDLTVTDLRRARNALGGT